MLKDRFVLVESILSCLAALRVFIRSRGVTALEILALRQQLAVLKRQRPRPSLNTCDRLFWTTLRRIWSRWTEVLILVKLKPRSGGIALVSASIGVGAPDPAAVGLRSTKRCVW